MEARSQGFGVRQTDLGSNCNPLLMSLVALLVLLSCSVAICEMGVRTVLLLQTVGRPPREKS